MPDGTQPVVGEAYELIESPRRIMYSWVWEAPDPLADFPMRVLFEFFRAGGKTAVVIIHHGIPSDQACSIHEDGWNGSLNSLERHLGMADREATT